MKVMYTCSKGKIRTILVDDEDYERLAKYRWSTHKSGNNYYAVRGSYLNGKPKRIYMHRDVVNAPPGVVVDHINHNTLDNRKENLRAISHQDNMLNRLPDKNSSSKYKGVQWYDRIGKFVAYFRKKHIGYFDKEDDAALAYNAFLFAGTNSTVGINHVPGIPKAKLVIMPKSYKPHQKLNKYRGVRRRSYNCWEAYIQAAGRRYVIGYRGSEDAAALLYNEECDRLNLSKRKNPVR